MTSHYRVSMVLPAAVVAVLVFAVARPAFAESCTLTIRGRSVLDEAPCQTAGRGKNLTLVTQGGAVLARIGRSTLALSAAVVNERPARSTRRRPGLTSFGAIVKSDSRDDKTCYFNQTVTLCVEL